ncbi:MAG: type II toxin-antitoxin system HicA family toxin [Pseudomonadota bacterium]|nr:type II toxin-antitoxin system HicA family toxin [Pseudomonadota bacterium]
MPVSSKNILKTLKANGWEVLRQSGSHIRMQHPDKPNKITVVDGKKSYSLGTLKSLEKETGLKFR